MVVNQLKSGEKKMDKIRLGRTNLEVTRVGIGGIPLQRPSEEDAIELVKYSLDRGINLIDTSIGYGESEIRIGKAIAGRRDDVVLITRTGVTDKKTATEHLERSLQQLQTDFIDVYEMHNISTTERYEAAIGEGGSIEAYLEARDQGKIGFIGITSHSIDTILKAVKSDLFDVILFPFNFVNNEAAEKLVPLTKKMDIGFTAMKPFAGGRLNDVNLVMKYLLQFDNVIPVPGVEKKEEIDQILEIVNGSCELTELEEQKIVEIRKELGKPFCQWCGYCLPNCPQEIAISSVINAKQMWKLWPEESMIRMYKGILQLAKTCIDCGACEEACPYQLPIREMMNEGIDYIESKIN
ncbi:MAG: aldo/keto reductase [Candidatus Heimdallarchaeota archaeon]|nr:aldo/keto reductase [Candidatus Heimdallarchaeota archaeon]